MTVSTVFEVHEGLSESTRISSISRRMTNSAAMQISALVLLGAGAALASGLIEFRLRIPGHAILRAVFPMALGLALVPVRKGGTVMGLGALGTALIMKACSVGHFGAGSLTSLALTGPLLDLALIGARRGWRLYLGFILAGMASNLVALGLRGGAKFLTGGMGGGRLMSEWWQQASFTYPVCGLLAGLLSAVVWFRLQGVTANRARKESGD
ncbi:MAG: hypothetical protein ACYC0X_12880 [Pirellulaceae bacterium]